MQYTTQENAVDDSQNYSSLSAAASVYVTFTHTAIEIR